MLTENLHQTLTVLYPLYKREVYKRREQMMRLTMIGAAGLIAMLCAWFLRSPAHEVSAHESLLIGLAGLLWSALVGGIVLQQQYRHRLAKQILVQLEQAMGFYEEGLFAEHQPLYPHAWKTAWLHDRSVGFYLSILGLLNGILLLALFL
ncbi:MAG TPA: hypothetical protein VFS39_00810 [Nitrospira sp.]|nr:hypothetical protein [Nitrospira sp.]